MTTYFSGSNIYLSYSAYTTGCNTEILKIDQGAGDNDITTSPYYVTNESRALGPDLITITTLLVIQVGSKEEEEHVEEEEDEAVLVVGLLWGVQIFQEELLNNSST